MRIGITGASGLIGSAFGRLASESGHEVVAFSRNQKLHFEWAKESWFLEGKTPVPLPEMLDDLDVVVHLAGESLLGYWTKLKKERIWSSRVDLTKELVSALAKASPRPGILVCASGVGFYGSRADELLDERSAKGAGFLSDLCREWEAAAMVAGRLNMRVVTLRTGMVLGRHGGAFPLLKKVFGLGAGGRLGDGSQWTSWIHLEDHVRLLLWAVENAAVSGPLNLVSPHPVTNAEFTRVLAARLRRPAFFHVPAFAMRLLLREMADEMLLASQRVVPRVALDLGFAFKHDTLDNAVGDLLGAKG